jgi:oligopeptide transport system substrate-binding protein
LQDSFGGNSITYLLLQTSMKRLLLIASIASFLVSCGGGEGESITPAEGKGGRKYGGTLRFNEVDKFQSLFPSSITDQISSHVASQIYEGLVKFDARTMKVLPALAESWGMDATGTKYTFKLRKGVKFHDNDCFADGKGREVTGEDVRYSFELLCKNDGINQNFGTTFKGRLAGADEYYNAGAQAKAGSLSGVKVVDANTLELTLVEPNISFLYILANSACGIVPKEGVEKYNAANTVGTGPFKVASIAGDSSLVILVKHKGYYGKDTLGNQLPFLDSIKISYVDNKKAEIDLFEKGELDFVWGLSADAVKTFLPAQIANFENKPPKFVLDHSAELVTQYYSFNTAKAPFNDVRVRKAFSLAIDRRYIVDEILAGEAFGPGLNGISPPALPSYKANEIKGYEQLGDNEQQTRQLRNANREMAKKLLAEAGFPNGKNFPVVKLVLNSGGGRNTRVAEEIQTQLRDVLNVNIEMANGSYQQKLNDERFGRADIFRAAWVADYPSPETFLSLFYGGDVPDSLNQPSYPNSARYKNPRFDSLYHAGRTAKTIEESHKFFFEAEQLMMSESPALILWYDENYRLSQARVKNFYTNPIRYLDFSQVYLDSIMTKSDNADGSAKTEAPKSDAKLEEEEKN